MGILLTIVIFLLFISLLVYVHELGHFITARLFGMRVDEFGFGFPPRLFGLVRRNGKLGFVWGSKVSEVPGKTIFSINAIPLGGFVRIYGENNDTGAAGSFASKSRLQRFVVLVSGCVMNWVLAWIIVSAGLVIGYPAAVDLHDLPPGSRVSNNRVILSQVILGDPADKAGLKPGDHILSINGKTIANTDDLYAMVLHHEGETFDFRVKRGEAEQTISVTSNKVVEEGHGPTGIVPVDVAALRFVWYQAPLEGFRATLDLTEGMVKGLTSIITTGDVSQVGGPVKIAQIAGESVRSGPSDTLQLLSLISVNLALINLLPIPALDGGRVLFLVIETIRRKRNSQKVEMYAHMIGMFTILALAVLISIKDIRSLT